MAEHGRDPESLTDLPERDGDALRDLVNGLDAAPDVGVGEETQEQVSSSKLLVGDEFVCGEYRQTTQRSSRLVQRISKG